MDSQYSAFRSEGTLGKSYCVYFNLISLFGLFFMIFIVLTAVYELMTKGPSSSQYYLGVFIAWLNAFFLYFQNKILFDMCKGSLQ
jgi:hypothetical protein